jgi:hypothetical protein
LGNTAGYVATGASSSNFIGGSAGQGATDANSSNFFGITLVLTQQVRLVQISWV